MFSIPEEKKTNRLSIQFLSIEYVLCAIANIKSRCYAFGCFHALLCVLQPETCFTLLDL